MSAYYEKLIDLWEAGKIEEASSYFEKWKAEALIGREETEELEKKIPDWGERFEGELEDNPDRMFRVYVQLKNMRGWDDETLCKKFGISKKSIEDTKNHRRPRSKKVGHKIAYELIRPLLAIMVNKKGVGRIHDHCWTKFRRLRVRLDY
jgi:hypothetical protein